MQQVLKKVKINLKIQLYHFKMQAHIWVYHKGCDSLHRDICLLCYWHFISEIGNSRLAVKQLDTLGDLVFLYNIYFKSGRKVGWFGVSSTSSNIRVPCPLARKELHRSHRIQTGSDLDASSLRTIFHDTQRCHGNLQKRTQPIVSPTDSVNNINNHVGTVALGVPLVVTKCSLIRQDLLKKRKTMTSTGNLANSDPPENHQLN